MKAYKRMMWFGAMLFSLGIGCGGADGASSTSDVLSVTGGSVYAEQLALADADGAGATDGSGRVQRSELDELPRLLGLTSDQIAAIQPILDATRAALENVRAQVKAGTLSPADARVQVKSLHDSQKQQIMALLTPEQQAKWSSMREHHCDRFDLTRLSEVLGLSADQLSQISEIQSAAKAKADDIHSQVEAGTLSKDDAHAQLEQLRKDTEAAISAVLTDEQKAKLAEILAAPRAPGGGPGGPPRR
jgi:Spy/CpxP family protein refolding chaperone